MAYPHGRRDRVASEVAGDRKPPLRGAVQVVQFPVLDAGIKIIAPMKTRPEGETVGTMIIKGVPIEACEVRRCTTVPEHDHGDSGKSTPLSVFPCDSVANIPATAPPPTHAATGETVLHQIKLFCDSLDETSALPPSEPGSLATTRHGPHKTLVAGRGWAQARGRPCARLLRAILHCTALPRQGSLEEGPTVVAVPFVSCQTLATEAVRGRTQSFTRILEMADGWNKLGSSSKCSTTTSVASATAPSLGLASSPPQPRVCASK